MKPAHDRKTQDHIRYCFNLAQEQEWPGGFNDRWQECYVQCSECRVKYEEDTDGYKNPEERRHKKGCVMAETMTSMRIFLDIQEELLLEQEDALLDPQPGITWHDLILAEEAA